MSKEKNSKPVTEEIPNWVKKTPELLPVWDWWVKDGRSTVTWLLVAGVCVAGWYAFKNWQAGRTAAANTALVNAFTADELEEAVADGYLVNYIGIKRGSKIMREGIKYDELSPEEKAQLEKVFEYERINKALEGEPGRDIAASEIFTYIFNDDTISHVLQDLMSNGLKIKGSEEIGKTIIFAYNHRHAEMIVEKFNKLFPEYGPDYCALIDNYVTYADDLIDKFADKNKEPQIAVSVDMLDTGIDVPEVLNLVFFKKVMSKAKFWQMIGRGTRLCKGLTCTDQIDGEYAPINVFLNYNYLPTTTEYHQHYFGFEGKHYQDNNPSKPHLTLNSDLNIFEGTNINTINNFGNNNNYRIINVGNPFDDTYSMFVDHEHIIQLDLNNAIYTNCQLKYNKCEKYWTYTPLGKGQASLNIKLDKE